MSLGVKNAAHLLLLLLLDLQDVLVDKVLVERFGGDGMCAVDFA